jgi:hypothetical protein
MYVPRPRERVQVVGLPGVFLVISVDQQRRAADLIPLHQSIDIQEGIPFDQLEPYREQPDSARAPAKPGH